MSSSSPDPRGSTPGEGSTRTNQNNKRLGSTYVSRACDGCRKRKMRCDGARPQCQGCQDRNIRCQFNDDDKRKTNAEQMEDMKGRMGRLENLIENLIKTLPSQPNANVPVAPSPDNATNIMSAPTVPPPPLTTAPAHSQRLPHDNLTLNPNLVHQPGPDSFVEERPIRALPMRPSSTSPVVNLLPSFAPTAISPQRGTVMQTPTSRIRTLGEGIDYERFQRVEETAGSLVQFGPTSLWTHKTQRPHQQVPIPSSQLEAGDWVDWSRNLPPHFVIDRSAHDQALEYFTSYYAPWCLFVDMPAFVADLSTCNLVRVSDHGQCKAPTQTVNYSPLLHCSVLYMGLHLIRHEQPALMKSLRAVFPKHCSTLMLKECDHTALSSLRAYNLYANCLHYLNQTASDYQPGDRQSTTGYMVSGLAIAGVHALGLSINSESYVARGLISEKERNLRDYAFWTAFILDVLRALAAGRQPMLSTRPEISYPQIDPAIDSTPWFAPIAHLPSISITGTRSFRSTCFHWQAQLAVIACSVLETLYSPGARAARNEAGMTSIASNLEAWYRDFPLTPADNTPLPHILLLHMTYHLLTIFVHRPFYRSSLPNSSEKCDNAALSILHLLQLFEKIHMVRYGHHNLINITFAAATVFLLRCVGSPTHDFARVTDMNHFNTCVDFMARISLTWPEAATAREVLLSLQSEWDLPESVNPPNVEAPSLFPPIDHMNDLHEWFVTQDLWGVSNTEQSMPWGGFPGS